MLLSRQKQFRSKKDLAKYSPQRKSNTNMRKLNNMIHSNSKYLTVPHGIPDHLKKNERDKSDNDRYKVYTVRSKDNPVIIPARITDIPVKLSRMYSQISDDELIFEGELMKYKPGMRFQYMSRWC